MNNLKILCTVFVIGCMIKELQCQCTTAAGGQGQCKVLNSCPALFALVNKPNGPTPQDVDFLKRSHCGYVGKSPAVCCPVNQTPPTQPTRPTPTGNRCTTPDRKTGQCIGLYSCAHITQMVQVKPLSQETVQFVQNSRCNGPEQYSVCCGPPPESVVTRPTFPPETVTRPTKDKSKVKCENIVSAIPPAADSPCCGLDTNVGDKIVGGIEAGIDMFPWLVLIEYARNDGQIRLYCGGSLISGRYVLTAAHCVVGKILSSGRPVRIRLGEHNTANDGPDCDGADCNKGAVSIPIEKIISHTEYDPSSAPKWHDIAVIRMTRLAPFNDFIRPICLPTTDITRTNSFYNLTVAGWGVVSEAQRNSSVKLYVDVPFVQRNRCQPAYGSKVPLWQGQICAGGVEGKDSCKGDSGGPLMWETNRRTFAVGIVSFGHKRCGISNVAAVYTNVYEYLNWIRGNISV